MRKLLTLKNYKEAQRKDSQSITAKIQVRSGFSRLGAGYSGANIQIVRIWDRKVRTPKPGVSGLKPGVSGFWIKESPDYNPDYPDFPAQKEVRKLKIQSNQLQTLRNFNQSFANSW